MNTILDKIVVQKKQDLVQHKQKLPLQELISLIQELPQGNKYSLYNNINTDNNSIIAEIKRHSPSKGDLRPDLNPIELAQSYEQAGASACSILTEEKFFHGNIRDLKQAREVLNIPILRKDFMIDEYQVYEAKYIGANCILLILAILDYEELESLAMLAQELNLDIIFEVHNQAELEKLLPLLPQIKKPIIGVNNRNLHTFEVSLNTSKELIQEYKLIAPEHTVWVSESGINSAQDIQELTEYGYRAYLIGESLLVSDNPSDKLKELVRSPDGTK